MRKMLSLNLGPLDDYQGSKGSSEKHRDLAFHSMLDVECSMLGVRVCKGLLGLLGFKT